MAEKVKCPTLLTKIIILYPSKISSFYLCFYYMSCHDLRIFSFLSSVVANSVSGNQVIESKCSEEDSRKKDMTCAHKFLEKMKNPSANCR